MHRATCREHREAKKNFETAVAKVERIKRERESLKAKFILRSHASKLFEACERKLQEALVGFEEYRNTLALRNTVII